MESCQRVVAKNEAVWLDCVCGADLPDEFFFLNPAARRRQTNVFEGALESYNGSLMQYQIPQSSLCVPVYEGMLTCNDGVSIPYIISAVEVSGPSAQTSFSTHPVHEATVLGGCMGNRSMQSPVHGLSDTNGVDAAIYRLSGQHLPRFAGCPRTEQLNSLHAELGEMAASGGRLLTKSDIGDLSYFVGNFERPPPAPTRQSCNIHPSGRFDSPTAPPIGRVPNRLPGEFLESESVHLSSQQIFPADSSFGCWHQASVTNQPGGPYPYPDGLPIPNCAQNYPMDTSMPGSQDHLAPYIMQGVASLDLKQDNATEINEAVANDLDLLEYVMEDMMPSEIDFGTPPQLARATRKRKLEEMRNKQGVLSVSHECRHIVQCNASRIPLILTYWLCRKQAC